MPVYHMTYLELELNYERLRYLFIMAARGSTRLFQSLRSGLSIQSRQVATKSGGLKKSAAPLVLGTLAAGAGTYGLYKYVSRETVTELAEAVKVLPQVSAASGPSSQPSVFSQGKDHALYLWIELTPEANAKEVVKAAKSLQKLVDQVTDPSLRDEMDEIWAGVGFSPNFYKQVGGKAKQDYTYAHRRGNLGDMPSSAGDVFIHAKCNTPSKLFELAQVFLASLPKGSVRDYEDIYSFVYKNGRDLSGFIDGTENAADDESREQIAVEKETGGSYVITQKWLHDMKLIGSEKDKVMEGWVGRTKSDSTEISRKSITSHVARMTGGNGFQQKKPFEIVRQSMPFGTLKDGCGLFFIGYSASPDNLNFMLDNMVGAGKDGPHCDDVMRLTKNVKGTYWYFPGNEELVKLH
ncbi:dye-decolorizing peroxidase YfeX-like [Ruditapes philippinarum]|uniref:dye-decolorizing peroxidase YfeX-like n=1 Tax=Ruditapes philippinarum TaxID=129788 RepID=UPI00295AB9A1|nr:dye-decolorizing peroxidase YfeX-like [Ruditapes philippinarum]